MFFEQNTPLSDLLLLGMGGGGGSCVVTGTFTAEQQSGNTYKLEFPGTYGSYLLLVEMTEESKAALIDSGNTATKMFAFQTVYPTPKIDDANASGGILSYRVTPSTEEYSLSQSTYQAIDGSSITLTCSTYGGGANILYKDQTYNYTIVPLG